MIRVQKAELIHIDNYFHLFSKTKTNFEHNKEYTSNNYLPLLKHNQDYASQQTWQIISNRHPCHPHYDSQVWYLMLTQDYDLERKKLYSYLLPMVNKIKVWFFHLLIRNISTTLCFYK